MYCTIYLSFRDILNYGVPSQRAVVPAVLPARSRKVIRTHRLRVRSNQEPYMEWLGTPLDTLNHQSMGDLQDPKMELLYHIRPYFVGIFPEIKAL